MLNPESGMAASTGFLPEAKMRSALRCATRQNARPGCLGRHPIGHIPPAKAVANYFAAQEILDMIA